MYLTLTLALALTAASAFLVATRQRSVIESQRRLLTATQALTATMTPTQSTRDVADTLNSGEALMVTVGHRGVTVGLVADKNTWYGGASNRDSTRGRRRNRHARSTGRVQIPADGLSVDEYADQTIDLFQERGA